MWSVLDSSLPHHDHPRNEQVGPDPYWGAAGLVGVSAGAPVTVLDNNTVDAAFGGISLVTFGQAAGLPAAQYGKSAHVNITGALRSLPVVVARVVAVRRDMICSCLM